MKFSIIIPNYNKGSYVKECLDSIYNQTIDKEKYELIFIDDGSTDNSLEFIEEYKKYDNFVLLHTNRRGAGGARNVGLDNAKGDYIVFIDSDDYLYSNTVLEQLDNQITNQDVIFLNLEKDKFGEVVTLIDEKTDIADKIQNTHLLGCPTKCFKRSIIGDLRFPERRRYEDVNFTLENLCKVETYDYFDGVFIVYRKVQNSNTTSEINGIAMTDVFLEISSLYYLCFKYPKYKEAVLKRIKRDRLRLRLDILDELIDTGENTFNRHF